MFVNHAQHIANFDVVPFPVCNAAEHAAALSADLEIDLVGLQFYDGFACPDGFAFMLQPTRHGGFEHGLAQWRYDDVNWHVTLRLCAYALSYASSTMGV